MNKTIIMGRLVADPECRVSAGENSMTIARYRLAVDRRRRSASEESITDFFNVVAFGRSGDFAEKYFKKGMRVLVTGRLQTGSYTNKDGVKINYVEIVAEEQEFADSKNSGSGQGQVASNSQPAPVADEADGFMPIPDGLDEELPFV